MALRLESIVKSDGALRIVPIESQREEYLRWHAFYREARRILEPELPVIPWMPDQTASPGIHALEP